MITPDDLDTKIRNLIALAGADTPPDPTIDFGTPNPHHTFRPRRALGTAAAIALIIAGTTTAIARSRQGDHTTNHIEPAGSVVTTTGQTTATNPAVTDVKPGDQIATLEIPSLDNLTVVIYAGVGTESLSKGAGHLPSSPSPGELGNAIVEGHRTVYGQDFIDLDKLAAGDRLIITTSTGQHYEYTVAATFIDTPTADLNLPDNINSASLTLYTCHPKYTAHQRLTIYAELDPTSSDTPNPTQPDNGNPTTTTDQPNALPC